MLARSGAAAFAILLLGAGAVSAQEEHVFETETLRVVHPWARAAEAGQETLVFFEIENSGDPVVLSGAQTQAAENVEIVGARLGGEGAIEYQPVGEFTVPAGDFHFDPDGLALHLTGLTETLSQGGEFELTLILGGEELEVHVEVEAANATQHSHAGHSH